MKFDAKDFVVVALIAAVVVYLISNVSFLSSFFGLRKTA